MDYGTAIIRTTQIEVAIDTGTHHKLTLYGGSPDGGYEELWSKVYPSRVSGLQIEATAGSIIHQRALSPASSEPLERYGVILPQGNVDWGTQADWVIDFGPVGTTTRRGLQSSTSSAPVKRGRVFAPHGEEVVGGAVSDASTTSGD